MFRKSKASISLVVLACFLSTLAAPAVYAKDTGGVYDERQMKLKADHVNAGKVYFDAKMYEKAIDQWEQALEIDPQDRKVVSMLDSAKKRLGIGVLTKEEQVARKKADAERKAREKREVLERRAAERARVQAERKEKAEAAKKKPAGAKKEEAPVAVPGPALEEKKEEAPAAPEVKEEAPLQPAPAVPAPGEEKPVMPEAEKPAAQPAAAEGEFPKIQIPTKLEQPIVVNGDQVEYFQDKKLVVGSGNISITYQDVVMTCDKITVHLDTKDAVAEGNVKITQKGAAFIGEQIAYNFETKVGNVINGDVKAKPFYGKAARIDKISDSQINIENGYATTCDLPDPHYRVQARQVRIYMNNRVVARNVKLYVGKIPILYLPYYMQPLNERGADMTLMAGSKDNWGYYALSSFRYYLNEIVNGKIRLDYRTKKGLAYGVDNRYALKGFGQGMLKFYCTNENDLLTYDKTGETEFKYRAQLRHKWDISDSTVMMAEINKVNDQYFMKDYFPKEYWENDIPDNYISFTNAQRDFTTRFLIEKRMDKYYTVVERMPEFDIDINNYKIGDTQFYVKSENRAVYLNETYSSLDQPQQKDVNTVRVDSYNQLSYAAKFFNFWHSTPYVGIRETYYSRNRWGETNELRTIFNAGIDNYMRFFRTYDVESDAFGMEIHQLRHIIMPSVNYFYVDKPSVSPDNLHEFDGIDTIDKSNGFTLALENKLQTKRLVDGEMKSVDLVRFIVGTDYFFRLEKDVFGVKEEKFDSVDFQLELFPYSWLYNITKMSVNPKKPDIETFSFDMTALGGEKWWLGLGYRYENVESGRENYATTDLFYKINDKWSVRAYDQFDLEKGSFYEQQYTVYRDLHCWVAELTFSVRNDNECSVWGAIRLKAFPSLPIGIQKSYPRATPGASQLGSN